REEVIRTGIPGAVELLADAADRADRPGGVDRAGSGDVGAAGGLPRRQLVDDAEGEHHARAGPADVVELDRDVDREVVLGRERDANQPRVDARHLLALRRDLDLLLL